MLKTKINEQIEAPKVRLISPDGKQLGVFKLKKALDTAQSQSMDLVLMAPDAKPPVCKILDYKKHIFDKKKQQGQAKRNHKRTILKEVKYRPDTDEGDYQVKTKRLVKFLSSGDRAKVTIRFRGREVVYKERGYDMLRRIEEQIGDIAEVEQQSKMEGKLLVTIFKPVSTKRSKPRHQLPGDNESAAVESAAAEPDNGKKLNGQAATEPKTTADPKPNGNDTTAASEPRAPSEEDTKNPAVN